MINFQGTGQIINDGWPEIRKQDFAWGNTALRMSFSYEHGFITTSLGNPNEAFRLVPGSFVIELYDKATNAVIPRPPEFFDQFGYDLSYNCFGYCFAESAYWILNPAVIIEDEYEETDYENAEFIIFKEHRSIGDDGEHVYTISHAVKFLENGNVSFKPGLNALVEDVPEDVAIHTYNFNHEIYLKRRA